MKSIVTACVLLLLMESVFSFPTQGLLAGDYACLDQQIGDDRCSFYSGLYDVTEADLFCLHWGSRCCLSCMEKRMEQVRQTKRTNNHGNDQKANIP